MNGLLHLVPIEAVYNPEFGLNRDERSERELAILEEDDSVDDSGVWLPLSSGIRRGPIYVLEARSPAQRVSIKFSPDAPDAGTYSIKPLLKGQVEEGVTKKVTQIPSSPVNPKFKRVASFQHRFVVTTLTSRHPYQKMVWIVGLDDPVESETI